MVGVVSRRVDTVGKRVWKGVRPPVVCRCALCCEFWGQVPLARALLDRALSRKRKLGTVGGLDGDQQTNALLK